MADVSLFLVFLILALPQGARSAVSPTAGGMTVELKDPQGKTVGTALLKETPKGVRIRLDAKGLPPGLKGIHIHENGQCAAPDFKSAGGHYNPGKTHHGKLSSEGPHLGDLPNLEVKANGQAKFTQMLPGATLKPGENSVRKPGGTAIVIHAGPDDLVSDPSGDSGDRIACGVIPEPKT